MGRRQRRHVAGMSGARAAAGDLERARSLGEGDVDERLLGAATAMFVALETFYKARRTYQDSHSAVERVFAQLDDRLRAVFALTEELEVVLTQRGLEVAGREVYVADRPETNTWFPLYRDGIRGLVLTMGVTRDELTRFCVVLLDLGTPRPEEQGDDRDDDAVTLLWDLSLEHLEFIANDPYAGGAVADEETRARVERIRGAVRVSTLKRLEVTPDESTYRDVEAARRLASVRIDAADFAVLASENLSSYRSLPEQLPNVDRINFVLAPAEHQALVQALRVDPDVAAKGSAAILQALLADERADRRTWAGACGQLGIAFTRLIDSGRLDRALELRRAVLAATQARPELSAQLDHAMGSEEAVEVLVAALARASESEVSVALALVQAMPSSTARGLLARLAAIPTGRRQIVCDVIAGWLEVAVHAVVSLLPASTEQLGPELLHVLRRVATVEAIAALGRATQHPVAVLRAGAVRLLAEIGEPGVVATRARVALLDPDPLVRAAALEIITAYRLPGGVAMIKELIEDPRFTELDVGEKTRLLIGYATVGGVAVAPDLVARLDQRNLMSRAAIDDERIAAALALGHLRYQPARPLLEKIAEGRLLRANVKEACVDALADLDRPPPSSPQRARSATRSPRLGGSTTQAPPMSVPRTITSTPPPLAPAPSSPPADDGGVPRVTFRPGRLTVVPPRADDPSAAAAPTPPGRPRDE